MRGARAALEQVVQRTSTTPIAIVWTHRVMLDDEDASRAAAARFGDGGGRIAHFVERENGLGNMISKSLGWPADAGGDAGAWDIYLYYGPDAKWTAEGPPKPTRYFHQLGMQTEDPGFASGDDLVAALRTATDDLLVPAEASSARRD